MSFYSAPVKLQDCQLHGVCSGAELMIVEGDSAAKAVAAVCDKRLQAVLPMQGKPMNALKATVPALQRNELFGALLTALGYGHLASCPETEFGRVSPAQCRYSRVVMLFDPDADGVHCGALMLMFFYRMLRPLLEAGHICQVRAPLYQFRIIKTGGRDGLEQDPEYAYSDEQARGIIKELTFEGYEFSRQRYRGLASIGSETLRDTCVQPKTRRIYRLQPQDAEAAISVFGPW